MKILHYSLGLPPYRTGGMTKFCADLISKQNENGDESALLWPGKISIVGKNVKIEKREESCGIPNYEIVNPLPISLNGGITAMEQYTEICQNPETYDDFFEIYKPDVLHIHTLMGLHKEVVQIAKQKGIKVIFTSHDYFGLCPKVTMFYNGGVCQNVENCINCTLCNEKALSKNKIILLQSPFYRKIKDWSLIKLIRRMLKGRFFKEDHNDSIVKEEKDRSREYIELRKYYLEILDMVDVFHYNSTQAKEIYEKYVPSIKGKGVVVNISHNEIVNNKKIKTFEMPIKITYLSSTVKSKGYDMLLSVMDQLWEEGERWFVLNLYNGEKNTRPYVVMHERYEYNELEKIFDNTDVLVTPSLWYETFGYTVLEALSFGVPVIATENVGAKDLLENKDFGILIGTEKEALKEAIIGIKNTDLLKKYNQNIVMEFDVEMYMNFYQRIREIYNV